jgi:hypothetical protein
MAGPDAVEVVFVDGAAGTEIGRAEMPRARVPQDLTAGTTVELAGTSWRVERADPATPAQRAAARTLVLTLRQVQMVPAQDILYSLPTICDVVPEPAQAGQVAAGLTMHDDDWRQKEFVAASQRDLVVAEIEAGRAIWDRHARRGDGGRLAGFDAIHVRAQPARPLPSPLPLSRLLSLPPPGRAGYCGVALTGAAGVLTGSFALDTGPAWLYGQAHGDAVHILGLLGPHDPGQVPAATAARDLGQVMQDFQLILVDWCRCAIIEPVGIGDYLSTITAP